MSSPPSEGYRRDIDGLRALSVLAVVGFHAYPWAVTGGFVGVDVFFVISGYLISGIILRGLRSQKFSFVEFYVRRICRIFPALILVLGFVWIAGWTALLPDQYRLLGRQIAASVLFAANFLFWNEASYFDTSAALKPLLHLWSLGVEEQFYLVWPLILLIAARWRVIGPAILAIGVLSFALNIVSTSTAPVAAFYLPAPRFWELLSGAGLAWWQLSRGERAGQWSPWLEICSWIGIYLLAGSFFGLNEALAFPGWWALPPVAGSLLVIFAGPATTLNRYLLGNPVVVAIGLISYPLYLWHWPILSFARISNPGPLSNSHTAVLIAVSFAAATATYLLVERPIRFGFVPRRKAAVALAAVMPFLLVAGAVTANSGFPDRWPEIFRDSNLVETAAVAYRQNECFLGGDATSFPADCVDAGPEGTPLIALWGDSHAAHLYPGLHALQGKRSFRLAQFTASACPPVLVDVLNLPNCKTLNLATLARLKALQPTTVIVSGQWAVLKLQGVELSHVDETLRALKDIGIRRIVLVGPAPSTPYLPFPQAVFEDYIAAGKIPLSVKGNLARALDAELRGKADAIGAVYVSMYDILCGADDTCLARTGERNEDFIEWDNVHLTVNGSRYVTARLPKEIFAPADPP